MYAPATLGSLVGGSEKLRSYDGASEYQTYPRGTQYFDADTMDASHIRMLLDTDTAYEESRDSLFLERVDIVDGEMSYSSESLSMPHIAERLRMTYMSEELSSQAPQKNVSIFFVPQRRSYYGGTAVCKVGIAKGAWEEVLRGLEVLPAWLELLHNNNGGFLSHVSYSSSSPRETRSIAGYLSGTISRREAEESESYSKSAYHVGVKIGNWGNNEWAVYARHDFTTGREVVLIAGTNTQDYCQSLRSRDTDFTSNFGMFHVLQDLAASWLRKAEDMRWAMDHSTQALESRTGFSCFIGGGARRHAAIERDDLRFDRDLHITADYISNVSWGSARLHEALSFLREQLGEFVETSRDANNTNNVFSRGEPSARTISLLHSAFSQHISQSSFQQAQLAQLQRRVAAQVSITRTLIAQRDTQNGIEIAEATKRDSALMRGIAAVTMVFLPATFVATFFSMVFFNVGDERKSLRFAVDGSVWLFPAVTVPLTVVVCIWYWGTCWGRAFVKQTTDDVVRRLRMWRKRRRKEARLDWASNV